MIDSAGPAIFNAAIVLARHLSRVIAAPTTADAGAHATLEAAVAAVRGCTLCVPHLPHDPRPVLRAGASARILIIDQAPGTEVHEPGLPWNDASGDRLRDWAGLDRDIFYDPARIAIIPMGLCYPGHGTGGDLPPRPECAPAWHPRLLPHLSELRLVILAGAYAIGAYARPLLGPAFARAPLSDVVTVWETLPQGIMPLPHPSPRNNRWLRDRPWFEERIVPALKQRVNRALGRLHSAIFRTTLQEKLKRRRSYRSIFFIYFKTTHAGHLCRLCRTVPETALGFHPERDDNRHDRRYVLDLGEDLRDGGRAYAPYRGSCACRLDRNV